MRQLDCSRVDTFGLVQPQHHSSALPYAKTTLSRALCSKTLTASVSIAALLTGLLLVSPPASALTACQEEGLCSPPPGVGGGSGSYGGGFSGGTLADSTSGASCSAGGGGGYNSGSYGYSNYNSGSYGYSNYNSGSYGYSNYDYSYTSSGGSTTSVWNDSSNYNYNSSAYTSYNDYTSYSGDSSSWLYSVGDPVNSSTGNKYALERDYAGAGPFPLRFVRTYNSLNRVSGIATTELGVGWRGTYDRSITLLTGQSAPTARVVRPDGKSFLFTLTNGVWTPDPDVTARLSSTNDAAGNPVGWTFTASDNSVETYDGSGRLLSMTNRAGLTQTLSYDAAGDLATVTDPFGRELTFAYDGQHRLVGMTDPAGGVYAYTYDGNNNLTSVTYPDGTTRTYLYEDTTFPNALTGLIDENGVRYATWTYDAQGRAVSSSLAGGVENVSLAYNADGTTSVTDARGATRTRAFTTISGAPRFTGMTVSCPTCTPITSAVTYDANGFVASRTDFNGNTTTYAYNSRGLLVSRTDAAGTAQARTVTLSWHPVFRRPTEIRFPDRVIDFTYDAHGNLITRTITDGTDTRTWTYQYNASGLLTQIDGPRTDVADITRFTYDSQGDLATVTNALNQVFRFTAYDANGRLLSLTDPNGVVTQFAYDARGRRVRRTRAGRTTTYAYDAAGDLSTITLPNGTTRQFTRDAAHRLVAVTDALGDRLQFTLDAAGDRIGRTLLDPAGNVVRSSSSAFDALGHLISRTNADGQTTAFTYDNDGHRLTVTDPLGRTASAAYDALNRRVSLTDPAGGVTQFTYDPHNHLTQVLAPNGAATQYQYDGLGDLVSESSPDRGELALTYNDAGEVVSKTDARGITATYRYDALNRLTAIHYPSDGAGTKAWKWLGQGDGDDRASDDVQFTYDAGRQCTFGIGRLCAVHDGSGVTRYGYDAFGAVTRQTETREGLSFTTGYTYDTLNRLMAITYPDGRSVHYGRDALDRIDGIDGTVNGQNAGLLKNLTYRPDGLPLTQTFGNGLTDLRLYDPTGRLIDQFIGAADTRVYGYDATGNLVSRQTLPQVDQFSYDALNRLIGQQQQTRSSVDRSWTYDANGNRESATLGATTTAYGYTPLSNRLIEVGNDTLALDAAGNTVADHHGQRTFTYDPAGRLIAVHDGHHLIARYRNNAFGERVEKRTESGITLYHYDVYGRLLSETDAEGVARRDYVWRGRIPVAQIDRTGPGLSEDGDSNRDAGEEPHLPAGPDRLVYLHTDAQGTPRVATDANQTVVWRWEGEAFGASAPSTNNVEDQRQADAGHHDDDHDASSRLRVTVNLRFPGQYYDRETGFFYNANRYYNPRTGRYITSDPVGLMGGVNTYAYANANPVMYVDPPGLWGGGISASVSTINPFTSGGGGVYGVNVEYTSSGGWGVYTFGTPNNDQSNGFQPGISVTLNGAQGTGDWSGSFDSTTGSYGLATGGFFESSPGGSTPGYFGWEGGISFGYPGVGSATTNYTQHWSSNSCSN